MKELRLEDPMEWDLYHRINGAPVRARLNRGKEYVQVRCPTHGLPVVCRTGEWDVREGEEGGGWRHTLSPQVFREFYTRMSG